MKTLSALITITLIALSSNLLAMNPKSDSINVVESSQKNLFVFKVDKNLLGGEVVVYHSNGEVVSSMTMKKKKMIIDFCDVKFGTYTIKVMMNETEVESFTYNKELILSQVIR